MKYCSHCGASLLDEAVVCPKCGCGVDYAAPKSAGQGGGQSYQYAQPQQNQSGIPYAEDKYSVMSIVGFVLVFFSVIAGIIVSILANGEARRMGSKKSAGLAKAGIIIASVKLGLAAFVVLVYIIIIAVILAV